jgi:hypothetical protein
MVVLLHQTLTETEHATPTPTPAEPTFYQRITFRVILFTILLAYMTYSNACLSRELFSTAGKLKSVLDALSKVAAYEPGLQEANEALISLLPTGLTRRRLFLKLCVIIRSQFLCFNFMIFPGKGCNR